MAASSSSLQSSRGEMLPGSGTSLLLLPGWKTRSFALALYLARRLCRRLQGGLARRAPSVQLRHLVRDAWLRRFFMGQYVYRGLSNIFDRLIFQGHAGIKEQGGMGTLHAIAHHV